MDIAGDITRRARCVIGPLLGLLAVCYFGYHVVHGDRGLLAWHRLERELISARAQLEALRSQRLVLEHRVSLLRPDSLDADLLDEVVRRNLGFGKADEMIIAAPQGEVR